MEKAGRGKLIHLIFFDTGIYEYFRALPFDYAAHVKNTRADFHTAHVSVDFRSPSRFDDQIEAGVQTREIGRTSLTIDVEIFSCERSETLVKGSLVWVNTDQSARRSVPLPKDRIRRIRELEPSL